MSLRLKLLIGFVIICLIWGSSWAAVKIGIESIPPLLSLAIRFAVAGIILRIHCFRKKSCSTNGEKVLEACTNYVFNIFYFSICSHLLGDSFK